MSSTITLQSVVNLASTHLDLLPLASVGGYTDEPALSLCNDVIQTLLAEPLDWRFNRAEMNMFVASPNRQDYLFAGATLFSLGSGQSAGIDLSSNTALSISGTTVTIKTLEQYNGAVGDVCYIRGTGSNYDSTLTQNGITSSFGGCTYTITVINGLTITATVSGGTPTSTSGSAGITDFGWLCGVTLVNINTNTAVFPTYHPEAVRNIQPTSVAGRPEKVCVIQDLGTGVLKIRLYPVPGFGAIWGLNCVYQKKAPLKSALSGGTWAPFPDELSFVYRQGFLAKGYRYINSPRSEAEEQKFQLAIRTALGADERETADVQLYPAVGFQTNDYIFWPL
jgi:hypothetical protein